MSKDCFVRALLRTPYGFFDQLGVAMPPRYQWLIDPNVGRATVKTPLHNY